MPLDAEHYPSSTRLYAAGGRTAILNGPGGRWHVLVARNQTAGRHRGIGRQGPRPRAPTIAHYRSEGLEMVADGTAGWRPCVPAHV